MAGSAFEEGFAAGAGPAAGFLTTVGENWKHVVEARATYYGLGDEFRDAGANWVQDVRLRQNLSVSLDLGVARRDARDVSEAQVRLNLYF
jgi:hypothetical protein